MLATSMLLAQTTQIGEWKTDEFTTAYAEKTWDFTQNMAEIITQPGTYTLMLTYVTGAHKLALSNAVMKADGEVVLSVPEEKTAGGSPRTIAYTFTLASVPQTLTLTANARTVGGTKSNGIITLSVGVVKQFLAMSDSYKSGQYYQKYTQVVLTGDRRTDIINVALSQLGYTAGSSIDDLSGNPAEQGAFSEPVYCYNVGQSAQGSWCSEFAWWCAALAGIGEDEFPRCGGGSSYIKSENIDYHPLADILSGGFVPTQGDVILYTTEEGAAPTHTGLVNSWTKKGDGSVVIKTVEGNVSDKVVERSYTLSADGLLNRNNWFVCGVGRPNYKHTITDQYEIHDGVLTVKDGVESVAKNLFRGNREITEVYLPSTCEKIEPYAFAEMPNLKKVSGLGNVRGIGQAAFYKCWNLASVDSLKKLETLDSHAFKYCVRLRNLYVPASLTNVGAEPFCGNTTLNVEDGSFIQQWISDSANCPHFTIMTNVGGNQTSDNRDVDFFCQTGWSQSDFLLNAIPSPGVERLGCWCTAFSQMLYHLRVTPEGSTQYLFKDTGDSIAVTFDPNAIDFSLILPELDNGASADRQQMTSLYCWYCLAAMGPRHNSTYFKRNLETFYPVKTSQIYSSAGREQVETFILDRLQKNQIVMAYREGEGTGHAMCIDGIRFVGDITYAHFNWGWGHTSDGWYNLWDVWSTAVIRLDDPVFFLLGIEEISPDPIVKDKWENDEFTTSWQKRTYDFSQYMAENVTAFEVTFTYTSGGKKLCGRNFSFIADGKEIASLPDEVSAGSNPRSFTLKCDIPEGTKTLHLKGEFRTDGGTKSNGTITAKATTPGGEVQPEPEPENILYIAEGTKTIANKAYYGNTKYEKVVFPSTITKIGNLAFHQCTNLKEVEIPSSVTSIGEAAFQNCTNLTKVILNEGLEKLLYRAFKNTPIEGITIPASVTEIGKEVFEGCTNLKTITVTNGSYAHTFFGSDPRLVVVGETPQVVPADTVIPVDTIVPVDTIIPIDTVKPADTASVTPIVTDKWVNGEFTTEWTMHAYDFSQYLAENVEKIAITFTYTSGGKKLCGRNFEFVADGKVIASLPEQVEAGAKPRSFTLSCDIPAGTQKLILQGEFFTSGGTNSNGNITVKTTTSGSGNNNQGGNNEPLPSGNTKWVAGEFTTEWTSRTYDLSEYVNDRVYGISVTFKYTDGGKKLCGRNFEFVADSVVVASLPDEVSAGYKPRAFTLTCEIPLGTKSLLLKGEFCTSGGTKSNGTITIKAAATEEELIMFGMEYLGYEDLEEIEDDINESAEQNVNIYTAGRTIVVENAADEISVYDVMGRLVARTGGDVPWRVSPKTTTINIEKSGVYIVRIGGFAKKVFVE